MWTTSAIARHHTPQVVKLGQDWADEIAEWSTQESGVSFPYVCRNEGIPSRLLIPGFYAARPSGSSFEASGKHLVKPVVVMTAWDRPHYMARVLESWRQVRWHRGRPHDLPVRAAPPDDRPDPRLGGVRRGDHRPGQPACSGSAARPTPAAPSLPGFRDRAQSSVILGEDDGIVTADLLEYMASGVRRPTGDDGDVFAVVCTFQDAAPGNYCDVRRTDWFFPPVWGIWRDRWEALKDDWPQGQVQGHSWDWWMITRMRAAGKAARHPADGHPLPADRRMGHLPARVPARGVGQTAVHC